MKNYVVYFILLTPLVSCNKDDEICDTALSELSSQQFDGTIYLCNGDANNAQWLDATANVTSYTAADITVHVASDSAFIDTTVTYSYNCDVVEDDIPLIYLLDGQGNEMGQYNKNPDRILLRFDHGNCQGNTHFEGQAI
ncbi:MAG: hypothetical protein HUJ25_01285 [Crocinitomicaceae bacterium]|nr:hypothetical protein [Crocinitomicaceae bacterium]